MLQLKFMSLILLICALTFTACKKESGNDNSLLLLILGGIHSAGEKQTYTADGVSFAMAYVPGGKTFPTGVDDNGDINGDATREVSPTATVTNAYWIGETEVTYELWYKVYIWATDVARGANQYTFTFGANAPRAGNDGTPGSETTSQEPVTYVNWRHAMVWCNALTEWYNAQKGTSYTCAYYTDSAYAIPIRSVNDTGSVTYPNPGGQDDPYVKTDATGFRLLSSNEWELAARYINGTTWLYGDHASGDQSGACYDDGSILGGQLLSAVFSNYAVYTTNSGASTAAVKSKTTGYNALGLYDMSGNVWEWCFDWYPGFVGSYRLGRGGDWVESAYRLQVGSVDTGHPYYVSNFIGFRFSRTQ